MTTARSGDQPPRPKDLRRAVVASSVECAGAPPGFRCADGVWSRCCWPWPPRPPTPRKGPARRWSVLPVASRGARSALDSGTRHFQGRRGLPVPQRHHPAPRRNGGPGQLRADGPTGRAALGPGLTARFPARSRACSAHCRGGPRCTPTSSTTSTPPATWRRRPAPARRRARVRAALPVRHSRLDQPAQPRASAAVRPDDRLLDTVREHRQHPGRGPAQLAPLLRGRQVLSFVPDNTGLIDNFSADHYCALYGMLPD